MPLTSEPLMASWKLNLTLQQAAVPPLAGFPVRNFNRSMIRSLLRTRRMNLSAGSIQAPFIISGNHLRI
jgi:hypothetical protein